MVRSMAGRHQMPSSQAGSLAPTGPASAWEWRQSVGLREGTKAIMVSAGPRDRGIPKGYPNGECLRGGGAKAIEAAAAMIEMIINGAATSSGKE